MLPELFGTISLYQIIAGISTIVAFLVGGSIYLERLTFADRMKSVVSERNRLRVKSRDDIAAARGNVRQQAKPFMKQIVDSFNLSTWLGTQDSKLQLSRAGFRGPQAEIGFLFFRLLMPGILGFIGVLYVFVLQVVEVEALTGVAIVVAAAFFGLKIPELYISNTITKRQASLRAAFPDALDLLLICVESGMSIEAAMRKVAQEIGVQSLPLAEEFGLTMAELSYLPDRKQAYENFAIRTDIDASKQISMVLMQAEQFGTPLGSALRIVSGESREKRLMEAERKAAALPPKLTVPLIVFFLPVLFVVILVPAMLKIFAK